MYMHVRIYMVFCYYMSCYCHKKILMSNSSFSKARSMSARPNHHHVQKRKVRADYLCGLRYRHLIPRPIDPPLDLKWKPDLERITDINRTSRTFRSKLLPLLISEPDLGMVYELSTIPSAFHGDDCNVNPRKIGHLDPKDTYLVVPPKDHVMGVARLKRNSNGPKPWLRNTQYISASESVYRGDNTDKTMESRMATLKINQMDLEQSPQQQIAAIEESFRIANDPEFLSKLEHPKNPKAKPVEILPILPEFEYKHVVVAQSSFDSDPWEGLPLEDDEERGKNRQKRISKALINPVVSGDDKFLMLYVPSSETADRLSNLKSYDDCKGHYYYKWVRDYVIDMNSLPKNSQLLFMERHVDEDVTKEKVMVYVPFAVRWNMKRRRQTERFRVPENYGKTTFLKYSYKALKDDLESQVGLLVDEKLDENEIKRIVKKRERIEHPNAKYDEDEIDRMIVKKQCIHNANNEHPSDEHQSEGFNEGENDQS
ncbi:RNA polymerase II-associated [Gigaspora margarita]|uniref:RNA polymerase II-associated n=1 Tax=Gigaspora margarita TaxID=4874 RepID=A0A8H4A9L2_GIGMA|nr:RNA polymerase II-associated [Gigaspora margarita]